MGEPLKFSGKFEDFVKWWKYEGVKGVSKKDEVSFQINPTEPEPSKQKSSKKGSGKKGGGGSSKKTASHTSKPSKNPGEGKSEPRTEPLKYKPTSYKTNPEDFKREMNYNRELSGIRTPNWFVSKIKSILKDNNAQRFGTNKTSGDLDFKHLYKIKTSSRVFCRKEVVDSKKYNIGLLVDCSGSMYGGQDRKAAMCASMLIKDLQDMCNLMVMGFNRRIIPLKEFDKKMPKNSLNKNINIPILEEVNGYSYEKSERLADKVGVYMAGNHDGYALKTMYEKMKDRKGQKIIIVLSDGRPHCDFGHKDIDCGLPGCGNNSEMEKMLKETIRVVEKQRIPVLAVGIETDCVKNYYKNCEVIHNVNKLHESVVKLLNKTVKRLPVMV